MSNFPNVALVRLKLIT